MGLRFDKRWLLGLLVLGALAIVLPNLPGMETRYETQVPEAGPLALFPGQVFNGEVSGGWTFYDLAVLPETLRISLKKGHDKFWVYFLPGANPRRLRAECRAGFCIHVPFTPGDPTFPPAVKAMADSLESAIAADGALFASRQAPTNLPAPWYEIFFLIVLAGIVWAAGGGAVAAWQKRDWFPIPTIALGAISLIYWSMGTVVGPLHANHHGAEELDFLLAPAEGLAPSYYGRSHQAVVDLLLGPFDRTPAGYFLLSMLVGAVGVIATTFLVRRLTGSRGAGLVAGLALGLHPIVMRSAMSETPFHFAAVFMLVGCWGLVAYRQDGDWRRLFLGHAALVLAVASHVLTLPLLALPLLVLLVPKKGDSRPRPWPQIAAAAASAILAVPHSIYQFQTNTGRASEILDPGKLWRAFSGYGNLLIDPSETPWVLLLFALLSLVPLAQRRWRPLGLVAGLVALMVPFFLMHSCFTDMVRYQVIPATLLCLAAGVGVSGVLSFVSGSRHTIAVAVAAVGLIAANAAMLDSHVTKFDAGSAEFAFVRGWASDSPPQSGVMVVPPEFHADLRIAAHFPRILLQDARMAYTVVTIPEFEQMVRDGGWPDEPVFYFEGLQLSWVTTVAALGDDGTRERAAVVKQQAARMRALADGDPMTRDITVPMLTPGYPTEFIDLPGNRTQIALYRLMKRD